MKKNIFREQHLLLGGIFVGLLCICLSCAKEPPKKKVLPKPVEEKTEHSEINSGDWNRTRMAVQTALVVFDPERFEKPLMKAVSENIRGKVSRNEAEKQIDRALETLLPVWKRKITEETMDFEVEIYRDDELERMLEETSMKPLIPLIRAYAIGKLKQKGQLKEE